MCLSAASLFATNASANVISGALEQGDSSFNSIASGFKIETFLFDEIFHTPVTAGLHTFSLFSGDDLAIAIYEDEFDPSSPVVPLASNDDYNTAVGATSFGTPSFGLESEFQVNLSLGTNYVFVITSYDEFAENGVLTGGGTGEYYATISPSVTLGSVAAVPEPQTYAMFLAGLGILGFASRAKKYS